MGACIGLGAGLARRSGRAIGRGVGAGILLGAIFGAIGGYGAARVEAHMLERRNAAAFDLVEQMRWVMVMHGVEWGLIGLGVGLAAGLAAYGMRGALQVGMAALIAGIIASPLYSVAAAYVFPTADVDIALPVDGGNGFLWVMFATVFIGLAVSRTVSALPNAPAARPAEA